MQFLKDEVYNTGIAKSKFKEQSDLGLRCLIMHICPETFWVNAVIVSVCCAYFWSNINNR